MRTTSVLTLAALTGLAAIGVVHADDLAPRKAVPKVALEYKRDPAARRDPDDAPAKSAPDLPDDLKVVVTVSPQVAAARRGAPRPAADPETLGDKAGETMALEATREWGWRQYWRAGFQRGAREALNDPRPATWERREGFRYGRLDPRAMTVGGSIAQDAAVDAAAGIAADRVRAQFADLSRDPRNDPASPGAAAASSRFMPSGPWADQPVFDDVFAAMPFGSAPGLSRDARAALDGWDAQPAGLTRDASASRAYDGAWKDSAYAFAVWRDRQRPGSYWTKFGPGERDRFRAAFFESFDDTFAAVDLRQVYAGWRVGYADGWRYGRAVNAEWAYRQGYADGFNDGVRAAAAMSFGFLFDKAYAAAYEREYQNWSRNPRPALEDVHVVDAGGDGVVEPGERVMLAGNIVNYGGADGTADVSVHGTILTAGDDASVRVAARSRVPMPRLVLAVAGNVPPRTQADLVVGLDDDRQKVPVYVSWPLELANEPSIESDPLRGTVRVALAVANRSRNPMRAETSIAGSGEPRRDRLDVPAGGTATTEAVYDGLRPLDLLAGTPRFDVSVARDGTLQDTRTVTLAPASTDLSSPDLVSYMIELAHTQRVPMRDITQARALLMDRMRADWQRAIAADGNPYKVDFEEGSASTALGELVRAVGGTKGRFANPDVFDGAGSDISALAEDLPGAHPMLRKWMKKLAKRVG
ncbi:MAG TPA: hypothetical protein VFV19_10830 [Candidatus Polarisedimenticolaceae bacterium]|nr:hypothetical protein [Candidatus Polarisedimenticolaceae bacterium]